MARSEYNLADYDTCDIHESTYPIHGKCSECVKDDAIKARRDAEDKYFKGYIPIDRERGE